MSPLLFALVDALLLEAVNEHREGYETVGTFARLFGTKMDRKRMALARRAIRHARLRLGWWRSLWGVL